MFTARYELLTIILVNFHLYRVNLTTLSAVETYGD